LIAERRKKENLDSYIYQYSNQLGSAISRQKNEIALNAARVETELASKAKSEFLANMSHELRTPLNAIIGFSEVIKSIDPDQCDYEQVKEYSGYIHESAHNLLKLINGVLVLTKIQAGTLSLDYRPSDPASLIDESLDGMKELVESRDVAIQWQKPAEFPQVLVDRHRYKQIATNIISNALKFTKSGGSVTIELVQPSPENFDLIVTDTGIGMTNKEVSNALQEFGQVDSGADRKYEGTGIGLAIVRALCQQHGGDFRISSKKDQGTKITISMPVNGSNARR